MECLLVTKYIKYHKLSGDIFGKTESETPPLLSEEFQAVECTDFTNFDLTYISNNQLTLRTNYELPSTQSVVGQIDSPLVIKNLPSNAWVIAEGIYCNTNTNGEITITPHHDEFEVILAGALKGEQTVTLTTLQQAKDKKWDQTKTQRDLVKLMGVNTPVGKIDIKLDSLVNILGATLAATLSGTQNTFSVAWTMFDNTETYINYPQLVNAGVIVAGRVDEIQSCSQSIRRSIEAAVTVQDLDMLDITDLTKWGL